MAKKEGYGLYGKKLKMWQWVLLYLVIGGVLYYLIYLLFFSNGYTY